MARDLDGPSGTDLPTACPLHCRARQDATPAEQVDWAGLPVNLDLAFSQNQRDKVYAQHLKFRRAGLGRRAPRAADVCVCELANHPDFNPDTRKSASGW
ncbi:hypothetical protein ACX9NE_05470 [Mycobacterium sp. ML4]